MFHHRRTIAILPIVLASLVGSRSAAAEPPQATVSSASISCAATASVDPHSRVHPGVAPAGLHGSVYLYGGETEAGVPLHDMWRWTGTRWVLVPTKHAPTLYDPFMAPDPLHAGFLILGVTARPQGNTPLQLQMWRWDGTDWRRLTPATLPSAGYFLVQMTAAVDTHAHTLLLSETVENAAYAVHNELWTWNGTTWRKLLMDKPGITGNTVPGTIVNGPGGAVYGLSGLAFTAASLVKWTGSAFVPVSVSGMPKSAVAASYDPAHDALVIIGSASSWLPDTPAPSDATYVFDGSRWTRAAFPLVHWAGMYVVGDAPHKDIVLWGGKRTQGFVARPAPKERAYPAVWRWTGTTWQRVLSGCGGGAKTPLGG